VQDTRGVFAAMSPSRYECVRGKIYPDVQETSALYHELQTFKGEEEFARMWLCEGGP
jgi:hypothetical protein